MRAFGSAWILSETTNFWNRFGSKVHLGLSSLTAMRILITGGFGFIGGRLAVHLSKSGHQIILASRVKRDVPDWLVFAETFHIDWCDESKTIGRKVGVPVDKRQYLCMYCPAAEYPTYKERLKLGLYK